MPARKHIRPGEKVPLKLTAAERKLVLEGLTSLDQEIEQAVKGTPAGQPMLMTLNDLDDFGGYVAAEANHCESKKAKKLDAIFEKIQALLDKFTDEEPPQTVKPETVAPKTIKIEKARKYHRTSDQAVQNAQPAAQATPKRTTKRKGKSKAASDKLYQFKITLLGVEPPIWRRIQVQDCTLDKLHEHIQSAMGWTNSHLHQFEIKGLRYGDPELLDDDFEDFESVECVDSTTTMISEILPAGRRFAFTYEYDFGDSWDHEVVFEGCPPADPKATYPLCVEGERACPPEDCGGIWGYADFLAAISNPKHAEHKSLLEWIGGPFDPEKFDPAKATKAMKKGLPDWRSMRMDF